MLRMACANVANLQLVRTESRSHELAVQAALGASRSRIALELVGENTLVALIGGALGLGLANVALPALLLMAALRFGVFRRRDVPAGADRESIRPESVTYVSGMNCHPCDRNRPLCFWSRRSDLNRRPADYESAAPLVPTRREWSMTFRCHALEASTGAIPTTTQQPTRVPH
jgi:FtsX-like permease family